MATQQLDIRPQEGFNEIYTLLVNNEITNPPYNENYNSKYFFFKKRKGIISKLELNGYDVLDYETTYNFILTRRQSDNAYVIFDNQGNQQLEITDGGVVDSFVNILGGSGTLVDSGTATGGSVTTLQDTNKSWTDNELAGYYVYIEDGTGAGQLRNIISNTSNTITVSGFDTAPGSGSQYKIYPTIDNNIAVPYSNGCYVYDGNSWVDRAVFSGFNIKGMIVWNSRLWFVAGNKIYYSEEGDYYYSPFGNELFISNTDVNNLYPFGDYLLVSTKENIGVVYKGFSTTDGTPFFVVKEGISQIGVKNRFGIGKYRDNVYFVGSDRRLYSLGISMSGNNISFKLIDNGSLPANFINQYNDKDIVVYSDVNYIYLLTTDGEKTYEIYYNDLHKGWLNNEYNAIILKKKFINSREYVLGKNFYGVRGGYKDLGVDYKQVIRSVIGESDIWLWKNVKYVNILLGKTDYIQNGILTVTSHIGNKKVSKDYDLGNSGYISDMGDVVEGTLGSNIMGYPIIGGDTSYIYNSISDIDILQIGLNITGQIIEFELNTSGGDNGIFFGGLYVYYNSLNPKLKYYKNII